MKIILRLIVAPGVLLLQIVAAFILVAKEYWRFICYGGELIVYQNKDERKTIKDIYNNLDPKMRIVTETIMKRYNELIVAVESKYPNETRHETALKYIKERENGSLTFKGDKRE